uniref:Integrase catalytic domain-containing protein n=1 Tax=Echeneis naucrates TaxID=173247 RepID=A0A665US80_ECHNA
LALLTLLTDTATVTRLRRLFASYGLPEQIVTDNATTFTSDEFQTFVKQNGILHTTSAPGHPATNGLAERYVQTFKTGMKKLANTTMNIDDRLSLFLLQYRTTPNCTTGQSPADLFLNRHVRTRLDFLKPCTKETVHKKQYQQKDRHDRSAADRSFCMDDAVYLRSTVGGDPKWIPGSVVRQTGPVSYEDRERDSNTVHRCHGDRLRARATAEPDPVLTDPRPEPVALRRSTRVTKPPKRFMQ